MKNLHALIFQSVVLVVAALAAKSHFDARAVWTQAEVRRASSLRKQAEVAYLKSLEENVDWTLQLLSKPENFNKLERRRFSHEEVRSALLSEAIKLLEENPRMRVLGATYRKRLVSLINSIRWVDDD